MAYLYRYEDLLFSVRYTITENKIIFKTGRYGRDLNINYYFVLQPVKNQPQDCFKTVASICPSFVGYNNRRKMQHNVTEIELDDWFRRFNESIALCHFELQVLEQTSRFIEIPQQNNDGVTTSIESRKMKRKAPEPFQETNVFNENRKQNNFSVQESGKSKKQSLEPSKLTNGVIENLQENKYSAKISVNKSRKIKTNKRIENPELDKNETGSSEEAIRKKAQPLESYNFIKGPQRNNDSVTTSNEESIKLEEKTQEMAQLIATVQQYILLKMVCSRCECYVVPPILQCPQNHVKCEDCKSDYCTICEEMYYWSPAPDLELFKEMLPLPCRWGCDQFFLSKKLRVHEKYCIRRKYKCILVCCDWNGPSEQLVKHWVPHHIPTKLFKQKHDFRLREGLEEFYIETDNEIFYCRLESKTKLKKFVHVRAVSPISAGKEYFAIVSLSHRCNGVEGPWIEIIRFKAGQLREIPPTRLEMFDTCVNFSIEFEINFE